VVTFPILVDVLVSHRFPRNPFDEFERLDDRNRVVAAAAQVVNLTDLRALNKPVHETCHIEGVNVVADLFTFVTKNLIGPALEIALDEVAEKPMHLDSGMVRPGQTAAAQAAGRHMKIAAVLLNHDIRGDFRRTKDPMHGAVEKSFSLGWSWSQPIEASSVN
jgi:hypothetical protein